MCYKYTAFLLLLFLGMLSLQSCGPEKREEVSIKRPNFLVIISDDQTYDAIHAVQNSRLKTPNLDRLVENGVLFSHAFNQGSWAGAVCVASRAMLLTGQSVFRTAQNTAYLDDWAQLYGPASYQLTRQTGVVFDETEVKTWGEVFTEAGYHTFLTGKWHNSEYALLKGFSEAQAVGAGMYETFDQNGSKEMAYNRPNGSNWTPWDPAYSGHWLPRVKDILYTPAGKKVIGAKYTVEQHTSELYADRAINFLQSSAKKSEQPFFMYVAFNAPHDPRQSPKEYVDLYPIDSMEVPENFLPEHPFDQGDHRIRDEVLAPFPRTEEAVRLHQQEYYAIISHFDHELGRILEALNNSGKADNTYVIFTSDHGLAVGKHGLMGKQNQYDHSIRMPLIISGPALEKGKKVDEMVYMQSLYATTCDLAGITIPQTVEFQSLERMLTEEVGQGEDYIFGSYRHLQRMIRSKEYKLIAYPEIKRLQLFDLIHDPLEMVDLAAEASHRDTLDTLFRQLVEKQLELGDFLILDKADYL